MLTVACVEAGNYLGRGGLYVRRLAAMVARHLSAPHRFVCLSDRVHRTVETLPIVEPAGWWAKLRLFEPGRFEGRVLYLDLDTVIVGPLDALVQHKGILHLARWGWTKNDYGSGVMVWDAGEHAEIFTRYTPSVPHCFRGDQDWMTHLGGWDALPDGLCVSYRYHCKRGVPAGASVVCFHGFRDKPHLATDPWVREHWRESWAGAMN